MGRLKWIAGFLGWVMVGPIGGLIGFLLGSAAESGLDFAQRMSDGQQPGAGGYYSATEQRNSFMISLLVLLEQQGVSLSDLERELALRHR